MGIVNSRNIWRSIRLNQNIFVYDFVILWVTLKKEKGKEKWGIKGECFPFWYHQFC